MSSKFYYYPDPGGLLTKVDLGETVSDLHPSPGSSSVGTMAGSGRWFYQYNPAGNSIRIINELFTDASVYRALQNLEEHLLSGEPVSFAVDSANVWGAFTTDDEIGSSRTDIVTAGNLFESYESAGTLAADDIVCVQSALPENVRRYCVVSSVSGDVITLTASLGKAVFHGPAFIREQDFYPVLRRPPGARGPIVTHDHRNNYTLDVTLIEDLGSLFHLSEAGPIINDTSVPAPGGTLQEAIMRGRQTEGRIDGVPTSRGYW